MQVHPDQHVAPGAGEVDGGHSPDAASRRDVTRDPGSARGLDTVADGQDFVDQMGVTYALGPDEGIIIRDYSVAGFPTTVFIDKDQRVVRKWTGILNEEKLEELIGDILN